MDRYLDSILRDGDTLAECICADVLNSRKIRFAGNQIPDYWFDECRQLHILGSPASVDELQRFGIQPGCFYDFSEEGLVVICATPQRVRYIIGRCGEELETVNIWFTDLESVDLSGLPNLLNLKMKHNPRLNRVIGLERLPFLQKLELNATSLGQNFDISRLGNLHELYVNGTGTRFSVSGISGLTQVRRLRLESVCVPGTLELSGLTALEEVHITDAELEKIRLDCPLPALRILRMSRLRPMDWGFLKHLTGLETLDLQQEQIEELPALGHCVKLRELLLADSAVRTLGTLPDTVCHLDLSGTGIRQVPESIRGLKELKRLNLNRTKLTQLPVWLADLKLPVCTDVSDAEEGIFCYLTKVEGVDMFAIPKKISWLKEWLEMQQPGTRKPPNEIKVVFLGDGEAGKSLLVQRLLEDGKKIDDYDGESTPGIAIYNSPMQLEENRTVMVHYWDYGGQEILYTMHRVFMTARTLYVVVLNARNDTQDNRARHWLQFISTVVKQPQVLLVLNKVDQNPRASLNETELKLKYPGLCGVVKISAREFDQKQFNESLTDVIREQIRTFDSLQNPVPALWHRVKQELEDLGEKYIRGDSFDEICDRLEIPDEGQKREDLLNLMCDMGVVFRCGKGRTKDYVLLQPEWVTNAIYMILFNKHKDIRNGIISYKQIRDCLKGKTVKGERHWHTKTGVTYDVDEVDYILNIMRTHDLSFALSDDREFIPMLCDRNASPLVRDYVDDPLSVEIWWQFDCLPESLLFQLMVNQYKRLDPDHVWMTGARFLDRHCEHSAIIRRDGNTLKIHARRGNGWQALGDYCREIENYIRDVIDEHFPGLCRDGDRVSRNKTGYEYRGVERLLVHKVGKEREMFDCLQLERAQTGAMLYSKGLDEYVPAKDILKWAYDGQDSARGKLVRDILSACASIQENWLYWSTREGSRENARNTAVRDSLRGKGFHVYDQTLCGRSQGCNQEGELDLEIRQEADQPWTVCEALNLSYANLSYWNVHLNKLLDNYNPHGLKFLFLISYVQCKEKRFKEIWNDFEQHIPEYDPRDYRCLPNTYMTLPTQYLENMNFIKGAQCTYDCGGSRTTVFHIFVRMGTVSPAEEKTDD